MRIAIIGSGISGLVCAHRLAAKHDVTIFEANSYAGGHTNTIDLPEAGLSIDTGFIVFNDRTYPNFIELITELGVASQNTEMSFSVRCDQTGLEYRGADLDGLFAQRRNLFRPRFYHFLREIVRFNRVAVQDEPDLDEATTVAEYFQQRRFSRMFLDKYFLPMASAIWSCPTGTIEEFPIRFLIEFYRHHGLLSINDRPQWKVICGGSKSYVTALLKPLRHNIELNQPVKHIARSDESVSIHLTDEVREFDHVIFACHSDQALQILGDHASPVERQVLGSFPYEANEAVLHTDTSLLPKRRRAWASWNYHLPETPSQHASLTYNMNILQGINSEETYCVTLNDTSRIAPEKIIRTIQYAHPIFTSQRKTAQSRHHELLGPNRTSFCGAYWGNGFHEDGVNSAINVCETLEQSQCKVAFTAVG